jgi:hypothetical protein
MIRYLFHDVRFLIAHPWDGGRCPYLRRHFARAERCMLERGHVCSHHGVGWIEPTLPPRDRSGCPFIRGQR